MKEKVFVLSARKYGFADQNTGEFRSGVTVYYVKDIEPVESSGNNKGIIPIKANFPDKVFSSFGRLPDYYDIDYDIVVGSNGKPKFIYNSALGAVDGD